MMLILYFCIRRKREFETTHLMEHNQKNTISSLGLISARNLLFDSAAVAFIILAPAVAHMLTFPLWYLEPMRLVLVLAIMHTSKQNGYLVALVLPFCSWAFSGHPELVKMVIITAELSANVALFYWLDRRIGNPFAAILVAILASKFLCYRLYWMVFSAVFLAAETGTVFLGVQLVVTLALSLYVFLLNRSKVRSL
jgi:hypothetical protein